MLCEDDVERAAEGRRPVAVGEFYVGFLLG